MGITSLDHDHQHEVVLFGGPRSEAPGAIAAAQTGGNPQTGIAPDAPINPEEWRVMPGPDGHVHELEALRGNQKKDPKEKSEYIECLRIFESQIENDKDCIKEADQCDDFYFGDQWPKQVRAKLESEERAALTINRCEALVDSLSGTMRQQRMDWRARPTSGGNQHVADLSTIVLKQVANENQLTAEEVEINEDQIIAGRGAYNLYPGVNNEGDKRLFIEWWNFKDFRCGPHVRKDLRDLEHLSTCRWFTPAQAKLLWPEHADDIPERWEGPEDTSKVTNSPENRYTNIAQTVTQWESNMWNEGMQAVRVVTLWRKEYTKKPKIYYQNIEDAWKDWSPDEAVKAQRIPGVRVEWAPVSRMRQTIFTAGTILQDGYPKLPRGVQWPLHIVYAHFRRGRWWGKLKAAKDPQQDMNKRFSQSIDILNKMAGCGWFYSRDQFANDNEYEQFKRNGGKPGFIVELMNVGNRPERVDGINPPTAVVDGIATSKELFNEVTAWSMSWINGSGDMSGESIAERQKNALLPNEFLFDNMRATKQRLGRDILAWVQDMMTADEIAKMIMTSDEWNQAKIGGQSSSEFKPEDITKLLTDADLTRYDVVVGEESWSPTVRMANFRMWSKIPNVPVQALIELSDLPNKERIQSIIAQSAQASKQAEDEKMKMELGKAAIAHGVDPAAIMAAGNPQPGQPQPGGNRG